MLTCITRFLIDLARGKTGFRLTMWHCIRPGRPPGWPMAASQASNRHRQLSMISGAAPNEHIAGGDGSYKRAPTVCRTDSRNEISRRMGDDQNGLAGCYTKREECICPLNRTNCTCRESESPKFDLVSICVLPLSCSTLQLRIQSQICPLPHGREPSLFAYRQSAIFAAREYLHRARPCGWPAYRISGNQ